MMSCQRIDDYERRCSSAVAGYNSGASPGLTQLLKTSETFGGFLRLLRSRLSGLLGFFGVRHMGLSKKRAISCQKIRYFTNTQYLPAGYTIKFQKSGQKMPITAAFRVPFARCVLCGALGGQIGAFAVLAVSLYG